MFESRLQREDYYIKESDEKNKRIMKELLTFFIPKYTKLEPKK